LYDTVALDQAPTCSNLLDGRWRLLFTTRPGSASPIQRAFTGVEAFSVFQEIFLEGEDGARVNNVVDFGPSIGYLKVWLHCKCHWERVNTSSWMGSHFDLDIHYYNSIFFQDEWLCVKVQNDGEWPYMSGTSSLMYPTLVQQLTYVAVSLPKVFKRIS
jgi:hypothetical protein